MVAYSRVTQADGIVILEVLCTIDPSSLRAGQAFYLSIQSVGILSRFQFHPFFVSWWDEEKPGTTKLSFLILPQKGLTKRLSLSSIAHPNVLLDGPYGIEKNLCEYGTVLLIATGIGISGHLSYIKRLLDLRQQRLVRTQCLRLIWEIREEGRCMC